MEENLKVLILSLVTSVLYFSSMIFLLKIRMVEDELPVYVRKVDTDTFGDLAVRLQGILNGLSTSSEKESEIAVLTGKRLGLIGRLKGAILTTFADSDITPRLVKMMVTALIANIIVSIAALNSMGPIAAMFLFVSLTALILSTVNVTSARRGAKKEADILNMMEINFLHYTNSPNYEEAVKKTIDSLSPMSTTYRILSGFLDKVYGLNVPKAEALQTIKEELGNIPHANQYFDIVIKAEETDPSYKKSLAGIPDFYSLVIKQKKDFVNAISIVFATYAIMGAIIVGLVFKATVENFAVLEALPQEPVTKYLYLGGFAIYSISGIVMFFSTLKKSEKRWG